VLHRDCVRHVHCVARNGIGDLPPHRREVPQVNDDRVPVFFTPVRERDAIRLRRAITLAYGGPKPADITMLAP
jgi:hypothetical protein